MTIRSYWMALLLVTAGFVPLTGVQAQSGAPNIRSFGVNQVPELVPGTELIFRLSGTAAGTVLLDVDGVPSQLGLSETSAGNYEGAYTISIRDKIAYNAKVKATLKLGNRQTTATLAQTLLTDASFARASAAAHPNPQISRIETRHSGALSGGHEISFVVNGSPGGAVQVSLDGGNTAIPLVEEKAGHYSGRYTIKTRDQVTETSQALVTLTVADKITRASKSLVNGAVVPTALVTPPPCDGCGVVQAVNIVKVKGKPNYLGAIAGGVAGAALGNQVGKGDGKSAATVLGAVGGAVAGREVEKRVRSDTRYDVVVKLDNGTTRTVSYESDPGLRVGGKVQFNGEVLQARD